MSLTAQPLRRRDPPDEGPRYVSFFFSSRRRHTRSDRDWSSDVCSSDLFGKSASEIASISLTRRPPQLPASAGLRSEERRVGKSVDLGGRRIIKKKKRTYEATVRA